MTSCAGRRFAAAAAAMASAVVLAGCASQPLTVEERFAAASDLNVPFKVAVGDVQAHIYDGDWEVGTYGNVPVECDDGYGFELTRIHMVDGWRLPTDAQATADDLGRWLTANGWEGVRTETRTGEELTSVVVEAANEADNVARLEVELVPRDVADAVHVRAWSTCEPGNRDDVMAVLYEDWPFNRLKTVLPLMEAPDAMPILGFDNQGQPILANTAPRE